LRAKRFTSWSNRLCTPHHSHRMSVGVKHDEIARRPSRCWAPHPHTSLPVGGVYARQARCTPTEAFA
jgi:hypothetical protein